MIEVYGVTLSASGYCALGSGFLIHMPSPHFIENSSDAIKSENGLMEGRTIVRADRPRLDTLVEEESIGPPLLYR